MQNHTQGVKWWHRAGPTKHSSSLTEMRPEWLHAQHHAKPPGMDNIHCSEAHLLTQGHNECSPQLQHKCCITTDTLQHLHAAARGRPHHGNQLKRLQYLAHKHNAVGCDRTLTGYACCCDCCCCSSSPSTDQETHLPTDHSKAWDTSRSIRPSNMC